MPTTLTATWQTNPARVLLQVTGAPTITPPYSSNFSAGVDGWLAGSGTPTLTAPSAGTPATLKIVPTAGTFGTATRNVTGLTIGQTYKVSAMARIVTGRMTLGVSGIGSTTYFTSTTRAALSYTFVATATSHILNVTQTSPTTFPSSSGEGYVDTVVVTRTSGWGGTTIRRTDVNGTSVVVREGPAGQDTTGVTGSGVMTVTDYECAVQGVPSYTVTDGNAGTATTTVTPTAPAGVWLTVPLKGDPVTPVAPPYVSVSLVTEWDESGDSSGTIHKVIGRSDPATNPGPLSLRTGTMKLWCATYAAATAIRAMLANGDTAQLRQPDYPGMDLYFVATRVRVSPEDVTPTQRWSATVDYTEVLAP